MIDRKMKKSVKILAWMIPVMLVSCTKSGFEDNPSAYPSGTSDEIDASCSVGQLSGTADGASSGIMTRSIIGQTTVASISGNFIKLDEDRNDLPREEYVPVSGPADWSKATIMNAEVLSSPDNTSGIHFRSVAFNPRQTYDYYSYDHDQDASTEDMVVGYISRMVGWYPKTFDVPAGVGEDGELADTPFKDAYTTYLEVGDKVCVLFKDKLDGQTDVMMTDMREGRYDLRPYDNGFKNNVNDRDVQPYGHMLEDDGSGYQYCNYFTFNHYLTCIRLFVQCEESALSLISWKQIYDVVFRDQPSTVAIELPVEQNRNGTGSSLVPGTTPTLPVEGADPIFGQPVRWEDEKNMPIIRTALAEDWTEYPEFADTPVYPVEMDYGVDLDRTYLGYMLVRPSCSTPIEIHTDAGVFSAEIPNIISVADGSGNVTQEEILKPGSIYNIVIDIKADGSLDVVVGNEDFEHFRNLSPYNESIKDFEYSNSYIVTPDMMKMGSDAYYDGFYFHAMVAGRGDLGVVSSSVADMYPDDIYFDPQSVRILWQDEPYLITHVELVHGYVRFVLNDECRTGNKKGNAVLAVYDGDGNIIWSWHIWVPGSGLQDVEYNLGETSFSMMNMNLGAVAATCSGTENALDTYGLYYMLGRKDPSPGPPDYNYAQADTRTREYWYMDQGARSSVDVIQDDNPTVEMSARNPLSLILPTRIGSYPNDWLYTSVDQLWGYSPSSGSIRFKTIYDPCPYGYRVADSELETLFDYCMGHIGSRFTDTGYGIMVDRSVSSSGDDENFFPYTGWRGHDAGRTDRTMAWYGVGELADYQDARVCKDGSEDNNHRGRSLLVKNRYHQVTNGDTYRGYLFTDWGNRASAAPVRCVRYDAEL